MRSEVWRPAAAARNRAPGGPGHRPPGTIRPGCEELAVRAAEEMLQTEARPPAENRHGGAPKGARLSAERRGRVANARPAALCAGPTGAQRSIGAPVGAPPPFVPGCTKFTPRAPSRRGNGWAV